MKERYVKDLEIENTVFMICLLIMVFLFMIWVCLAIKEKNDLKKENGRLQQQVIDYRWQLEQVEYIIECYRGE